MVLTTNQALYNLFTPLRLAAQAIRLLPVAWQQDFATFTQNKAIAVGDFSPSDKAVPVATPTKEVATSANG